MGARESLNGWKNMARRKVKNGEKSPWGKCLTRPVPNGRRRSAFWLGRKTKKFSGTNQKPERRRPFGTGLVRHCPQGLFSPFFTFLRAIFFLPFSLSLAPTIRPWVSEDAHRYVFFNFQLNMSVVYRVVQFSFLHAWSVAIPFLTLELNSRTQLWKRFSLITSLRWR